MTKSVRRLVLVVLVALLLVAALAVCACKQDDGWGTVFNYQTAYAEAQELGYAGSLQDFIASITGKDGTDGKDGVGIKSVTVNSESHLIVTLSNDIIVDCGSIKGDKGDTGENGTDGVTPQLKVGEDNFWYVSYDNGATWTCLDVKATGADGAQGEQGVSIVSTAFDENGNTVITYSDGTTQTIEHNWEKSFVLVEADCLTEGKELYSCTDCGLVRVVTVPKTGHTDGKWITYREPTCTQSGSKYQVCSVCGVTIKTEFIPKTDHTYTETTVAPTFTMQGYTLHTCHCGASYIDNYVDCIDKQNYLNCVVESPVAATEYKFALWQANSKKVLYATGEMIGSYLATTEEASEAAAIKLEVAEGGYYLNLGGKYITLTGSWSGKYVRAAVSLTDTATTVFTIGSHDELIASASAKDDNGADQTGDFYLGTYGSYATISASSTSYIEDVTTIDNSQFPTRLISLDGSGSDTTTPSGSVAAKIDCTQGAEALGLTITKTGEYTTFDGTTKTGGIQKSFTSNGVSFVNDIARSTSEVIVTSDSKHIRCYMNSTITIGYTGMTQITITTDGEKNFKGTETVNVAGAIVSVDGTVCRIVFTEAVDSVTITLSGSQVRITEIAVYTKSGGGGTVTPDAALATILAKYSDIDSWNFRTTYVLECEGEYSYDDVLSFIGENFAWQYEYEDETYVDYVWYDEAKDQYVYYYDNGDGTYTAYYETDDEDDFYELYAYAPYLDLSELTADLFTKSNDCYVANDPAVVGNTVLGDWGDDCTFTELKLYVTNGYISKIVATQEDTSEYYGGTYTFTLEFSKYGEISITLPDGDDNGDSGDSSGSGSGSSSTGTVMPEQTYDSETFDNENLQDKLLEYENSDGYEGGIGLPSTGTYNALVVPVQFGNKVITDTALNNLNIALNGTSAQTGWESVNTYYQKSSFGKLNLSFDIWNYNIGTEQGNFTAKYSVKYYEDSTDNDGYSNGSDLLLKEVLTWLEDKIDLTKYDTNGDGFIDAVYLIYDNDVDYNDGDFWWAYVTWYQGEETYDGKGAYYYLFAGFDFMMEDVNGGGITDSVIEGLKVNAVTYIHETGHLLGLDDYYDYNTSKGSNKGLGGADMMDYNVGDHNKYSKIMLGWLEPTIISTTQTFTIDLTDNDTSNDCVLIFLNGNNSYFCEYLLIDLYTATGLNELHANASGTYLYGGAKYGARIYHVSSAIDNPYNEEEYGSFTNNNNSVTKNELIKLVEADGQTSSSRTKEGIWASASDLWQTGSTLKTVFPNYARQDGKLLNFDVSFDSVTATSATITVTFVTAE